MRHTTQLTTLVVFALGLLLPALVARAQDKAAPEATPAARSAMIAATATATVEAVDPASRTVILKTADGDMIPVKCGENVINFDQIKPGDEVRATAVDRVAVSVSKNAPPDANDNGSGRVIMRAAKGEKPGFAIVDTAQMRERVEAIDPLAKTITLQGADGKPTTINVAPEVDLSGIAKGDQVTLRVTSGIALTVTTPGEEGARPAAAAIAAVTRTATVESIDKEKRLVTLKNAEGKTRTIHLGKEAINFDQIEVGDQVRATLAEEVAVSIDKAGATPAAEVESGVVTRAPKGSKPSVLIAASKHVTGKIESIDPQKRTVTFAATDGGKPRTVKVGAKVDFSSLKAGDEVTARVTEALAIVVEKP